MTVAKSRRIVVEVLFLLGMGLAIVGTGQGLAALVALAVGHQEAVGALTDGQVAVAAVLLPILALLGWVHIVERFGHRHGVWRRP